MMPKPDFIVDKSIPKMWVQLVGTATLFGLVIGIVIWASAMTFGEMACH